jgi:hypothetical protein
MTRLIDADTLARTLREPKFAAYLENTVGQVFNSMVAHLDDAGDEAALGFKM